ncbi:MAG TPA: hypothetical protein VHK90_15915, partial [Thermoanaerobaculia bacterium]|nr:hypothetical protein [Thermoanaerobaculia bacterium]
MTRKQRLTAAIAAVLILAVALIATLLLRQRVQRHRVFRPSAGEEKPVPPRGVPPVEQWSEAFRVTDGEDLVELLEAIEQRHPDLYKKWSLAYLHARALIEDDEGDDAARKLAPFLEKGHPFRDRALFHRASIAEDAEASRFRNTLIFEHPDSPYRDEAIDDELAFLASRDGAQPLIAFAEKIAPSASTERRREISARIVEATGSFERGMAVLRGGIGDDAADRVVRALDKPEILAKLDPEQLALFGETLQRHRHYERAVVLLQLALQRRPGGAAAASAAGRSAPPDRERDELQF